MVRMIDMFPEAVRKKLDFFNKDKYTIATEEVDLKEALPKGNYIGEALITGYNKETGEEVGKTIVELNITSQ